MKYRYVLPTAAVLISAASGVIWWGPNSAPVEKPIVQVDTPPNPVISETPATEPRLGFVAEQELEVQQTTEEEVLADQEPLQGNTLDQQFGEYETEIEWRAAQEELGYDDWREEYVEYEFDTLKAYSDAGDWRATLLLADMQKWNFNQRITGFLLATAQSGKPGPLSLLHDGYTVGNDQELAELLAASYLMQKLNHPNPKNLRFENDASANVLQEANLIADAWWLELQAMRVDVAGAPFLEEGI